MKKELLFLLILTIICTTRSFSQSNTRGTVKGVLIDTLGGHQPLVNATVSITPLGGDSTETEYTVSGKGGIFQFKGIRVGQYKLLITYEGYNHIERQVRIADSAANVDLASLYMSRSDKMLAEVVIQRPPLGVKKDTVEYSAGAFATKPNAVAEDLLKKLPGVTVDNSGSVTAHGETVQRILVDGKRFFSDDPKLATRNLPPDIIDKIQVFDDLSDQSKFTGFDDGNRVKTINIVTKKNSRKGYFGKLIGSGGTNEDYDESINMHRFNGNSQFSLLGQGNDINKQNFTPQDIFGSTGGGGGGRRGGGGGGGGFGGGGGGGGLSAATSPQSTGVTTVWAGGLNYRNTFGTNPNHSTDIYGSYFYNATHTVVRQTDSSISPVETNYASDSALVNSGNSYTISRVRNHRIYLNIESRLDTNNSIVFRPNITFQKSTPNGTSFTEETDNHGNPINSSYNLTSSTNSGININGSNLQFRHRFAKPFRTLSIDVNTTANINNGTGTNYAINNIFIRHVTDTLNQFYYDSLHSWTVTPTLSYTEPIAKNQILQFTYNHVYTNSTTINRTYDFVDSIKGYTSFDSLFSNSYKFKQNADQAALAWRIQNAKFNLSLGSGVQWTSFNSDNTTKGIVVKHDYVNYTPTVNFNYQFSSTQHLRVNYSGRTGTPNAAQLQPLTTTSDSISFQQGNPGLKPQFTHSLRLLYANFNPGNQHVIFATINASTIVNDIQSAVYRNANGGQTSTYVNLGGTYNVSGFFNYGFPLKNPKSNLNFMTNVTYAQSQSLLAQDSLSAVSNRYAHEYTRNTGLNETIRWTTNIKKNFDMNFSSTTGYTINKNPGVQRAGSDSAKAGSSNVSSSNNLNTFTETLSAEFTAYTNSGWLIAANFDYTYTYTHSSTYTAHIPLLTPSIAKQLFKKKNGELRLTVFDVLDKNTAVSKTVGSFGAVTYNRTNVLSRYAMLTFTYNLNNFAGANQRRMPGMFPGGGRFRGGGGGGGIRDGGGNFPVN
jgi:uncharacterized membrane protein YgcG